MRSTVPRLVVVLDRAWCRLPWLNVVTQALNAGAEMVQLREPGEPESVLDEMLSKLSDQAIDMSRIAVNGWPSLAANHSTHLHLPERMTDERTALATGRLLSRSAHSEVPVETDADFVILGNVRETPSHIGRPGLGATRVAEVVATSTVPVVVIGGIDPAHVGEFMGAGAYGVAVRSYVIGSDDPGMATKLIKRELENWK